MTAIDIGAQFGVYALPMARRSQRVSAYETDSEARGHLEAGPTTDGWAVTAQLPPVPTPREAEVPS